MQEMTAAYAGARSRNHSRYANVRSKKCAAMRAAKERKRLESDDVREPAWTPPELRRIVAIIDLDSGTPRVKVMHLYRGDRIDRYTVKTARGQSKGSVGWSRILETVRKGIPRVHG